MLCAATRQGSSRQGSSRCCGPVGDEPGERAHRPLRKSIIRNLVPKRLFISVLFPAERANRQQATALKRATLHEEDLPRRTQSSRRGLSYKQGSLSCEIQYQHQLQAVREGSRWRRTSSPLLCGPMMATTAYDRPRSGRATSRQKEAKPSLSYAPAPSTSCSVGGSTPAILRAGGDLAATSSWLRSRA